jgi:hypothetical protein
MGSTVDVVGAKLLRTAYFWPLIIEISRFFPTCKDTGDSGAIYPYLASDVGITSPSLV